MMYPFSFLFETPSTAFVTLGVGNVFIEMITTVTIFVLENSQEEDLEEVSAVSYNATCYPGQLQTSLIRISKSYLFM